MAASRVPMVFLHCRRQAASRRGCGPDALPRGHTRVTIVALGKDTAMATRRLGIVMNGVTGRMGTNQHLIRSIAAIRAEGGLKLASGDVLMPDPILVGRNAVRLEALARAHNVARWTTDIDAALADPADELFFDA